MLSLSCFACNDSEECNVQEDAKISVTDNHQQHNHDSENCTPFCTCSCCAVSTFYSNAAKTNTSNVVFISAKYPLYNIAFNTDVYYSIWQPPKIS
jgi:hypothetical protein